MEIARLQQLEGEPRHAPSAPTPLEVPTDAEPMASDTGSPADHADTAGPDEPEVDRVVRARGPRKAALIGLAVVVPLAAVAGFVAGALLAALGEREPAASLFHTAASAADHEEARARALDVQAWDHDRVELLGAVDDVTVWWGTVDDQTCVVVVAEPFRRLAGCDDTESVRTDGLRFHGEFFHVPQAEGGSDTVGEAEGVSTNVTFVGNPYAGQFMVLRDGK